MPDTLEYWEQQTNLQNRKGMEPTYYCCRCRDLLRKIVLVSYEEGPCSICSRELRNAEVLERL